MKKDNYKFFAFTNRLKLISRWSLMHNRFNESVAEHSQQTAIFAHALGVIDNKIFNLKTDANLCATLALFHDTTEVLTGDMPTPVKYRNSAMTDAYSEAEKNAQKQLLDCLPIELKDCYTPLFCLDKNARECHIVEYADKLSALVKCMQETASGNNEFLNAKKSTLDKIKSYNDKTVNYFLDNFIDAFELNLDELLV